MTVEASIDVGSNSAHLLVAVAAGHRLEPLVDESVLLGIGATIDGAGFLGRARRAELVSALVRYVETAHRLGAHHVTIVGTEPLRRAADAPAIVAEVTRATAESMYVLSHEEEGLLTLLGVTNGRRASSEVGVVDIGGGSTQVVLAGPGRTPVAVGVTLGSARLTARLVEHDPPTQGELALLRSTVRDRIGEAPAGAPHELTAVGGTASNLLRVVPAAALDRTMTRRRIAEALATLGSEPSEQASARHAVNLVRARILPAGAVILDAVLERYGLDRVHISEAGIREGAILASARAGTGWRDGLAELARGWNR